MGVTVKKCHMIMSGNDCFRLKQKQLTELTLPDVE